MVAFDVSGMSVCNALTGPKQHVCMRSHLSLPAVHILVLLIVSISIVIRVTITLESGESLEARFQTDKRNRACGDHAL